MQAIMNFRRKSTDGFSIGNILLDFLGGCTNYSQMIVQSIDQSMLCRLNWIILPLELSFMSTVDINSVAFFFQILGLTFMEI